MNIHQAWGTTAVVLAIVGAAWATSALALRSSQVRVPVARAVSVASQQDRGRAFEGGERPNLEVDLVPDAVIKTGANERIEYHAEIKSNLGLPGAVAWTAIVVDDLGIERAKLGTGATTIAQ